MCDTIIFIIAGKHYLAAKLGNNVLRHFSACSGRNIHVAKFGKICATPLIIFIAGKQYLAAKLGN